MGGYTGDHHYRSCLAVYRLTSGKILSKWAPAMWNLVRGSRLSPAAVRLSFCRESVFEIFLLKKTEQKINSFLFVPSFLWPQHQPGLNEWTGHGQVGGMVGGSAQRHHLSTLNCLAGLMRIISCSLDGIFPLWPGLDCSLISSWSPSFVKIH